jgi:hypothetical protein
MPAVIRPSTLPRQQVEAELAKPCDEPVNSRRLLL